LIHISVNQKGKEAKKARKRKESKGKKEAKKKRRVWALANLLAVETVEAERGVPTTNSKLLRRLFLPGGAPRERPHGGAALDAYDLGPGTTIAYGDDTAVQAERQVKAVQRPSTAERLERQLYDSYACLSTAGAERVGGVAGASRPRYCSNGVRMGSVQNDEDNGVAGRKVTWTMCERGSMKR
jgi:hypothetical protein